MKKHYLAIIAILLLILFFIPFIPNWLRVIFFIMSVIFTIIDLEINNDSDIPFGY
jgi:hypothetical protein